jgi:hypothetical protein
MPVREGMVEVDPPTPRRWFPGPGENVSILEAVLLKKNLHTPIEIFDAEACRTWRAIPDLTKDGRSSETLPRPIGI